jgi:hypothetical protein
MNIQSTYLGYQRNRLTSCLIPCLVGMPSHSLLMYSLLQYVYRYEPNPTIPNLLSGLDCSLKWTIPDLRLYAIDHLNAHVRCGHVHAALALSLARRHGIPKWIAPVVCELKDLSLWSWCKIPF